MSAVENFLAAEFLFSRYDVKNDITLLIRVNSLDVALNQIHEFDHHLSSVTI